LRTLGFDAVSHLNAGRHVQVLQACALQLVKHYAQLGWTQTFTLQTVCRCALSTALCSASNRQVEVRLRGWASRAEHMPKR